MEAAQSLDEVDAYSASADAERGPVSLVEARSLTFARRRKVLLVATPTIRGLSRIKDEFEVSDQRRFFVPCPSYDTMQWQKLERLRWEEGRREPAEYLCEGCERPIAEHHKTRMLKCGEWRATATAADATTGSAFNRRGWSRCRNHADCGTPKHRQNDGRQCPLRLTSQDRRERRHTAQGGAGRDRHGPLSRLLLQPSLDDLAIGPVRWRRVAAPAVVCRGHAGVRLWNRGKAYRNRSNRGKGTAETARAHRDGGTPQGQRLRAKSQRPMRDRSDAFCVCPGSRVPLGRLGRAAGEPQHAGGCRWRGAGRVRSAGVRTRSPQPTRRALPSALADQCTGGG